MGTYPILAVLKSKRLEDWIAVGEIEIADSTTCDRGMLTERESESARAVKDLRNFSSALA